MTPEPDEHQNEDHEHEQRTIDPDAPGRWIDDPEGDAPEPNEPA